MTFWLGVSVAYVVVVLVGLSLGRHLAERYDGPGGGDAYPNDLPVPPGPAFALDVPPLGSAFDRALLPGAFEEHSGSATESV